jgi:hypothetical protein
VKPHLTWVWWFKIEESPGKAASSFQQSEVQVVASDYQGAQAVLDEVVNTRRNSNNGYIIIEMKRLMQVWRML